MMLIKILLALALLISFSWFIIPYWRDQWIFYRLTKILRKQQKQFPPESEDYVSIQKFLDELQRMKGESRMGEWME